MAETKCPCLVVYNHRLGERLSGSGSQSDRYIIERAAFDCVQTVYDGTLSIDDNRCVTLPNGITGILNTDIPSLTDSEFMIVFDEPIKNMSIDVKPGPYDDVDRTTIHSITFDIDQVANSLTFSIPDNILFGNKRSYGYWGTSSPRHFNSAAYGSSIHSMSFNSFVPAGGTTSWLDTTVGTVQPLFFSIIAGTVTGPKVVERTGDLKILMKFDLTLGAYNTAANAALKFEIGYYDEATDFTFYRITQASWSATRAVTNDELALDRRHYQGQVVFNTINHNDAPVFENSDLLYSGMNILGGGFALLRPLAIRTIANTGNPTLVMTDLKMNYKWIY